MISTANKNASISKDVINIINKKPNSNKKSSSPMNRYTQSSLKNHQKTKFKEIMRVALDKFKKMKRMKNISSKIYRDENVAHKHLNDNTKIKNRKNPRKLRVNTEFSDIENNNHDKLHTNINKRFSGSKLIYTQNTPKVIKESNNQKDKLKISLKNKHKSRLSSMIGFESKKQSHIDNILPLTTHTNFNDFCFNNTPGLKNNAKISFLKKRHSVIIDSKINSEQALLDKTANKQIINNDYTVEHRNSNKSKMIKRSRSSVASVLNISEVKKHPNINEKVEAKKDHHEKAHEQISIIRKPSIEKDFIPQNKEPFKHVAYSNFAIKMEIPRMSKECKSYYKVSLPKHKAIKDNLNKDNNIASINFTQHTSLNNSRFKLESEDNLFISDNDANSKASKFEAIIDIIEKELSGLNNCAMNMKGYFQDPKTPYSYDINIIDYKSYWMDCVNRMLNSDDLDNVSDIGYYKIFMQHKMFNKILFQDDIKRNEYLESLGLPSLLDNYFFFFEKLKSDLLKDHSVFIADF